MVLACFFIVLILFSYFLLFMVYALMMFGWFVWFFINFGCGLGPSDDDDHEVIIEQV